MNKLILTLGRAGFWIVHGPYALFLVIDNWRLRKQLERLKRIDNE